MDCWLDCYCRRLHSPHRKTNDAEILVSNNWIAACIFLTAGADR